MRTRLMGKFFPSAVEREAEIRNSELEANAELAKLEQWLKNEITVRLRNEFKTLDREYEQEPSDNVARMNFNMGFQKGLQKATAVIEQWEITLREKRNV